MCFFRVWFRVESGLQGATGRDAAAPNVNRPGSESCATSLPLADDQEDHDLNNDRIIQQLLDKDEIRELTARYCHAVVDGDADTIVSLFCSDGVFRSHTLAPQGHDELRSFYAAGVGQRTHKPFVHNHVIEFDSEDLAHGRCSVEIRVLQDGQPYTQAGHYLDRYRRGHCRNRHHGCG